MVEFTHPDGTSDAFMATQLPTPLDDVLKSLTYQQTVALFDQVSSLTPEKLVSVLPMTFPLTYHLTMPNGQTMKGIAKYPLSKWEHEKRPYLDEVGRAKLCMTLAEGDPENLSMIMTVAYDYRDKAERGIPISLRMSSIRREIRGSPGGQS